MSSRPIVYSVLFSACFLAALAAARDAGAQILSPTSTSTSSSSSGSTSTSGSTSSSVSRGGAGGNATSAATATGGNAATTGTNGLTFNQGNNSPVSNPAAPSDITVRSAPQVYVPNVITGNVCALGASAGASFIGTGVAFGASWESEQCERRQTAALLHNAGYRDASRELMCDKREIYDAMKRAGTPCLTRPDWEPKVIAGGQLPTRLAPAVVTPAPAYMPPQPKVYPRCNPRAGIVDDCQS